MPWSDRNQQAASEGGADGLDCLRHLPRTVQHPRRQPGPADVMTDKVQDLEQLDKAAKHVVLRHEVEVTFVTETSGS